MRSMTERTLKQRKSIMTYLEKQETPVSRQQVWNGARGLKGENGMRLTNLLAGLVRDGHIVRTGTRKTAVYQTTAAADLCRETQPKVSTEDVHTRVDGAREWPDMQKSLQGLRGVALRIDALIGVNDRVHDENTRLKAAIIAFVNGTSTVAELRGVLE
jgi:hypothetical protein